ncbi:V-type proton ATPase subunit F-like [Solanum dulcamara]|uniref:V-type proton ATPase subunit F-like n=1 Tax=Solanum dulcamara TaxID=45834 RepID=UPI0024868ECF|nr:V-type proton ATPase subunit F-like [Solanum dulcamara]
MANRAPVKTNNSALIAMIADEDTIIGFYLAGVGNVDLRRKTNYLIVDSKKKREEKSLRKNLPVQHRTPNEAANFFRY